MRWHLILTGWLGFLPEYEQIWIMIAYLIFVPKYIIFRNLQWGLHLNLPNFSVSSERSMCVYCPGSQSSVFPACTWCQLDPAISNPNNMVSLGGINLLHGFPIKSSRTPLGWESACGQLETGLSAHTHAQSSPHRSATLFTGAAYYNEPKSCIHASGKWEGGKLPRAWINKAHVQTKSRERPW